MINRVILLVVDGLGVGALTDAAEYGDEGAHTLSHLADAVGGLNLPTLESLGLGHVGEIKGLRIMAQPIGCFGRLAFRSKGVDSLAGHWELAGCIIASGEPSSPEGFASALATEIERVFGRKILGKLEASRKKMIGEFEQEHLSSGSPIVWTDSRRTCHIAAHESAMRPEELYQRCKEARKALREAFGIWRVVAHPLGGPAGAVRFNSGRRDFAVEPPQQTMLDILNRASQILIGVGKVGDLFSGRGLTRAVSLDSWTTAFDEVNGMLTKVPRGLIYASLDVLDSGAHESASSLHEFDRRLPDLIEQLRPGDVFILTGDHGRDQSKKSGLPTREHVPLVLTGPRLAQGVNLGVRGSAADLGQTIVEALRGEPLSVGESFLDALQAG